MSSFTPPQIVDAMHAADKELDVVSTQFAWLKGQHDYWKGKLEYALATAKVRDDGPVIKSKEAALVSVTNELSVRPAWLPDVTLSLPDMVRVCAASLDVVSKRYDYLERHLGVLQSVNKNVMMDYGRTNSYG